MKFSVAYKNPSPIVHVFLSVMAALLATSWMFAARVAAAAPAWSAPAMIQAGPGNADNPQISFDAVGNAIAIWSQNVRAKSADPNHYKIHVAHYTPISGWSASKTIQTGMEDGEHPQVAFDAAGNAMAVWTEGNIVTAARYNAKAGWSVPSVIQTGKFHGDHPQIKMDAAGNAIAVWAHDYGSGKSNITAVAYSAKTGWGRPAIIQNGAAEAVLPQLAMDAAGNAIAVWVQDNGSGKKNINAAYHKAGAGWSAPRIIQMGTGESGSGYKHVSATRVAFDGSGNAIAIWLQKNDAGKPNLMAARYSVAGGWGKPGSIQAGLEEAKLPSLALNRAGNAMAVWAQKNGGNFNIAAARYAAGSGWSKPGIIQSGNSDAEYAEVGMDAVGNAVAVWRQKGAHKYNYEANAARYTAAGGWSKPSVIQAGTSNAEQTRIAVDAAGNAMAVWLQQNETEKYNVTANKLPVK